MKTITRYGLLLFLLTLGFCNACWGQGEFYREYWAEFDSLVSNHRDGRWRVNDAGLSLHKDFGIRQEARANGLMLVNVPEDLFQLTRAELYLELWDGHPKTSHKRFFVNGRGPYPIPGDATKEGDMIYSYPTIRLQVSHLVTGVNAFQFAVDRGNSFWGHFIIDNAAVRAVLNSDHPELTSNALAEFFAVPKIHGDIFNVGNVLTVSLSCSERYASMIESVDYIARYTGFDDDGDRVDGDWHGFTLDKKPINHVGSSTAFPFKVNWKTDMVPDQPKPIALKAVVHFKNGLHYRTPVLDGIEFKANRRVIMITCADLPVPFHSRASREVIARFYLPDELTDLQRAQLWVKTWDGGAGTIKDPFTINGYPYTIISGKAVHDVIFTVIDLKLHHLKPGENTIRLYSDTHHHGIEILGPGPCFVLKYKR
jgi:hypothetical protein